MGSRMSCDLYYCSAGWVSSRYVYVHPRFFLFFWNYRKRTFDNVRLNEKCEFFFYIHGVQSIQVEFKEVFE